MKACVWMAVGVIGWSSLAFGSVIFSDNFEGETVGSAPSNWTVSTTYGSFEVLAEGNPGNAMFSSVYNWAYTVDSKQTFTAAEMPEWTLTFDLVNYQQYSPWSYAKILNTPGNFMLQKDQHRAIDVYNGDGTFLGSTSGGLVTDIWTNYSVSYNGGVLTVTATNTNGSTTGSFSGAVPDFTSHNQISFGDVDPRVQDRQSIWVDNVVLDAVPEPATLSLLGLATLGLLRRKR